MARPKKENNRTRRISASFTDEEFNQILTKAEKAKITPADFVYQASLNKEIKVTDSINFQFIKEINAIGRNLNLIAKKPRIDELDVKVLEKYLAEVRELRDKWQ